MSEIHACMCTKPKPVYLVWLWLQPRLDCHPKWRPNYIPNFLQGDLTWLTIYLVTWYASKYSYKVTCCVLKCFNRMTTSYRVFWLCPSWSLYYSITQWLVSLSMITNLQYPYCLDNQFTQFTAKSCLVYQKGVTNIYVKILRIFTGLTFGHGNAYLNC